MSVPGNDEETTPALGSPETQAQECILVLYLLRQFREGPGYWLVPSDSLPYRSYSVADAVTKDGRLRHGRLLLPQSSTDGRV